MPDLSPEQPACPWLTSGTRAWKGSEMEHQNWRVSWTTGRSQCERPRRGNGPNHHRASV